ncbi:MAG: acyl-CoA/acyl-ACP dehydrogenase [Deltaproteobacteria bacterium]|nr:acyl-CoA/acyl-ACP dehydrogenase [Deltaproteobacteria bacterium]MBW2418590.1 acyl-CoA/acyl-ACP dehydrogenase [Deltaproteobacteria bacterium]
MDLDFTEEQDMLRDMVRGVCAEYSPLEVVRAMEDDPTGYSADFWKQLGELDLLGLLIPEEYGGSDMTLLEGAVVYEEFGRSLAPSPHFESAVLSASVLLAAGSDEQKKEWLPKIAAGDAILTPAWLEPGNGFGAKGVQMRAEASGDDVVLSGTKLHVGYASAATRLVVLARTGNAEGDVDLFLVDPQAEGVKLSQQMTLASDTQYRVDFDGVKVPASSRIGGAASGWATWSTVMHDGIILLAAIAVGGSQQALDMTCEFAKEREQFGKPLAAFQAISHYLADAATNVSGAQTLMYEAAWARANHKPLDRLAPMAKLFASQTYRDLTAMAEQVYGGVGFTIEYDIQLFFRRAKQLQITWWDTRYLEELVASNVLD